MRYPTRAFQSDTTVVSNDRRRHHRVSQTKAAPAPTGAAFTYPLDRSAYISDSQIQCPTHVHWDTYMRLGRGFTIRLAPPYNWSSSAIASRSNQDVNSTSA